MLLNIDGYTIMNYGRKNWKNIKEPHPWMRLPFERETKKGGWEEKFKY
jgi:hypothetical protein